MRPVLDEARTPPQLSGAPTDPLGQRASSSTDTSPPPTSSPSPADGETVGRDEAMSVLIYCHGEPVHAPLVGGGFALCGCGRFVRVVS